MSQHEQKGTYKTTTTTLHILLLLYRRHINICARVIDGLQQYI